MKLNKFVKKLLPPLLIEIANRFFTSTGKWWSVEYPSWEKAFAASSGYDDSEILEKVSNATSRVVRGESACERDSVNFDSIEYSWPMLAGLMYAAAKNGGKINLIDFGGSLGSAYYQNRLFLKGFQQVSWHVVEQSHFVERGREIFQKKQLRFNKSIEEAFGENPEISIVLFGSVLQYLGEPYKVLEKVFKSNARYIVIDRTTFTSTDADKITVQRVPSHIYKASYPCRFFSVTNFMSFFKENGYELVESFESNEGIFDKRHFWSGMIFEKT